ncbi:unnamed protein product [Adineta ricciae]|uniref:Uncharacterized protein n=1 Tax=Adineta ricciae TaxID=249248 RepID=A0A814UEB1_ADIRI|nr:unnamed protein product [Adineta ricciae]
MYKSSQSLDTLVSKDNSQSKWWRNSQYRTIFIFLTIVLTLLIVILSLMLKYMVFVPMKPETIVTTIPNGTHQWKWSATHKNMNVGRKFHTASVLNNGKVLVTGGFYHDILNSVELYDPSKDSWSSAVSMTFGRYMHTASLLSDGTVLVTGGNDGYTGQNSTELYDPSTETWTTVDRMNHGRIQHTASVLKNGKVLVTGGKHGDDYHRSAELYDSSTKGWANAGYMNDARVEHTATMLNNGKILLTGGHNLRALNTAELYDPSTGIWTTTGSMNHARYSHTASLLTNGKVLVAGGLNSNGALDSAELYDPSTEIWTTTANMNYTRCKVRCLTRYLFCRPTRDNYSYCLSLNIFQNFVHTKEQYNPYVIIGYFSMRSEEKYYRATTCKIERILGCSKTVCREWMRSMPLNDCFGLQLNVSYVVTTHARNHYLTRLNSSDVCYYNINNHNEVKWNKFNVTPYLVMFISGVLLIFIAILYSIIVARICPAVECDQELSPEQEQMLNNFFMSF